MSPSPSIHYLSQYQNAAEQTLQSASNRRHMPDLSNEPLLSLPAMVVSQPGFRPRTPVSEVARSTVSSVGTSVLDDAVSSAPTYQTDATLLPPLQVPGGDPVGLEPLADEEIDPGSFDLVVPANANGVGFYSLEQRSKLLFSREHLQVIFDDTVLLHRFAAFLCTHRPVSTPLFTYYMEALKALRAIQYSNAVARGLESMRSYVFTNVAPIEETVNDTLREKADAAFDLLARNDLPAYITHTWIRTVTVSIKRRISGSLPTELQKLSEGLAEVFCLTDPSRHDNPIVFASEEFHKTTQYGMSYVIGRNCRFLQGPASNSDSVARIRDHIAAGKEHFETFLNYRRDGTPFMNLLMLAPLFDSRGKVRYHLGAQIDVSGLVKECYGLDSFKRLVDDEEAKHDYISSSQLKETEAKRDSFQELSELFNSRELETVRQCGGHMHRPENEDQQTKAGDSAPGPNWQRPRVLIQDGDSNDSLSPKSVLETQPIKSETGQTPSSLVNVHGCLSGVYEHYLLVRPYPSLRVLFASPSLRVPGMLQSHFLHKIGGSERVRDELKQAMEEGQRVTAKVWWTFSSRRNCGHNNNDEGRSRWIHCTPLLGSNGSIGVWMVVVLDDETEAQHQSRSSSLPNSSPKTGNRTPSNSRPRFKSELDPQRAMLHDYHTVTRALHHQGSSNALRLPSRISAGDDNGGGFSRLDTLFKTPSVNKSRGQQGVRATAVESEKGTPVSLYCGGDDTSVESMASSAFTVRIGNIGD